MTVTCECGKTSVSMPDDSPLTFASLRCWNCPPAEPAKPKLTLVKP